MALTAKTKRFDASSPEEDRSVDFGSYLTPLQYNQYDLQVFDDNGDPVNMVSSGKVTLEIELKNSSQRRDSAGDIALAREPWSFTPFLLQDVSKAVFEVTSLPTGYTLQAFCKRGVSVDG